MVLNLYWIQSRAVVLATGGGGHLFTNTTNPPQSSGEGIALAWKAGAIEDLGFVHFVNRFKILWCTLFLNI